MRSARDKEIRCTGLAGHGIAGAAVVTGVCSRVVVHVVVAVQMSLAGVTQTRYSWLQSLRLRGVGDECNGRRLHHPVTLTHGVLGHIHVPEVGMDVVEWSRRAACGRLPAVACTCGPAVANARVRSGGENRTTGAAGHLRATTFGHLTSDLQVPDCILNLSLGQAVDVRSLLHGRGLWRASRTVDRWRHGLLCW